MTERHNTGVRGVWLSRRSQACGAVSWGHTDACRPEVRDCHCEMHEQSEGVCDGVRARQTLSLSLGLGLCHCETRIQP